MDKIRAFDGHCDAIFRAYLKKDGFRQNPGHISLEKLAAFDRYAQFYACFAVRGYTNGKTMWEACRDQAALFHSEVEVNGDLMVFCTGTGDLERAWEQGKIAAFLSAEGGDMLDCDPENLQPAHDMGVRAVNITWNYANTLSGTNVEEPDRGLTDRGRAFVREMNRLGMLVDVSHLSDPGFWDVAETTSAPIFASHSNSRKVCGHTRNLTDEQFLEIIKLQGVAGLNLCPDFVGEDPDLDTAVRHLEHFLDLGGEDNIALGGDWDGVSALPKGVQDVTGWISLHSRLEELGYSQTMLDKLFYKNLMRVVSSVCFM